MKAKSIRGNSSEEIRQSLENYLAFGPLMSEEIRGVKEIWNVPMVGMFSNAELGRSEGGQLEMHNLSSCCVVLKEK